MKSAFFALITLLWVAAPAWAVDWELDAKNSHISFGVITNDTRGETFRVPRFSGLVTPQGDVEVAMTLTAIPTGDADRDAHMQANVFRDQGVIITTQVNMGMFSALPVGDHVQLELGAFVSFMDRKIPVYLNIFALRVSEYELMISSEKPVYINFEDLGLNTGVDALEGLGGLDSIARVTPVTFRLMFLGF